METESHDGAAIPSTLVVAPFWRRIMAIAIASRVDSEVLPSTCFHVLCMVSCKLGCMYVDA
jgi:hypothetical protein